MRELLEKFKKLKMIVPVAVVGAMLTNSVVDYVAPVIDVSGEAVDYLAQIQTQDQTADQEQISEGRKIEAKQKKKTKKPKVAKHEKSSSQPLATQVVDSRPLEQIEEKGQYVDGIYSGSAQGFGGIISVQVQIISGQIASIDITSAPGEGDAYLARAKAVIDMIISGQTTNVDVVSGATYSSKGIINAVRSALAAAGGDSQTEGTDLEQDNTNVVETPVEGTDKKSQDSEEKEDGTGSDQNENKDEKISYKNGTYNITVKCVPDSTNAFDEYDLNMKIKIRSDKIVSIKDISGSGEDFNPINNNFIALAKDIVSDITSKGTYEDVDVVTGATCTSNAIIEACKQAFAEAVEKTVSDGESENKKADTDQENKKEDNKKEENKKDKNKKEQNEKDKNKDEKVENREGDQSQEDADKENDVQEDISDEEEQEPEAANKYKDGVYAVTAICSDGYDSFDDYTLSGKVEIKDDNIVAITDVKGVGSGYADYDLYYINRAINGTSKYPGIVAQIISKGTIDDIDVVSGATYSSEAVIELCRQAQKKARIEI